MLSTFSCAYEFKSFAQVIGCFIYGIVLYMSRYRHVSDMEFMDVISKGSLLIHLQNDALCWAEVLKFD